MPDPSTTNYNPNGIVLWDPTYEDDILIDAGGDTYAAGTVLGRITASTKLTAYTSGAVDGSEVPIAVLQDELVLAAATDVSCRPIIAGKARRVDLVAHGVGALTQAEVDALRDRVIIALNSTQLAELDNQ